MALGVAVGGGGWREEAFGTGWLGPLGGGWQAIGWVAGDWLVGWVGGARGWGRGISFHFPPKSQLRRKIRSDKEKKRKKKKKKKKKKIIK